MPNGTGCATRLYLWRTRGADYEEGRSIGPQENRLSNGNFKILAFAGSLRRNSINRGLLEAAKEAAPEGVEIEIYDISNIPLYNDDLNPANPPEPVRDFKNRIKEADAIMIATPEYNYSIPGVLKNALDWASRPLTDNALRQKPAAILGATGGISGT